MRCIRFPAVAGIQEVGWTCVTVGKVRPHARNHRWTKEKTTMPISRAKARWEGNLQEGSGTAALESGAFEGPYSFATRFEGARGTNPEEWIGAALSGCFSMALSKRLEDAGHPPKAIETRAEVTLEKSRDGFAIARISLETEGSVPGMTAEAFENQAEEVKKTCPVSKALAGTAIDLKATLRD